MSKRRTPEEQIGPIVLAYPVRRAWWPLVFAANLLLRTLWYFGEAIQKTAAWILHHRLQATEWLLIFFWRSLTLLSVSYLVYDRIYETDATVSVAASSPSNPFGAPFAISNNSHVFAIRKVSWMCQLMHAKTSQNLIRDERVVRGSISMIPAGQILNIDCNVLGPTSRFFRIDVKEKIEEAEMRIFLAYEADLFGYFSLQRKPLPTKFTWRGDLDNPQWIKGEFAK